MFLWVLWIALLEQNLTDWPMAVKMHSLPPQYLLVLFPTCFAHFFTVVTLNFYYFLEVLLLLADGLHSKHKNKSLLVGLIDPAQVPSHLVSLVRSRTLTLVLFKAPRDTNERPGWRAAAAIHPLPCSRLLSPSPEPLPSPKEESNPFPWGPSSFPSRRSPPSLVPSSSTPSHTLVIGTDHVLNKPPLLTWRSDCSLCLECLGHPGKPPSHTWQFFSYPSKPNINVTLPWKTSLRPHTVLIAS